MVWVVWDINGYKWWYRATMCYPSNLEKNSMNEVYGDNSSSILRGFSQSYMLMKMVQKAILVKGE